MLLHKANRDRFPAGGRGWAAGLVIVLALGAAALRAQETEPDSPGQPPPSPDRQVARTLPAGEAIEIETIGGRESIPVADAARLAITGGDGTARPQLILDGRRIPVEDILFIRLPAGQPREASPFLLLLRSGAEVAGTVTGGDDASVRFRAALLGDDPRSIPIDDVKGLIVERTNVGGHATLPGRPVTLPGRPGEAAREGSVRQRIRSQISRGKLEKDAIVLLEGGRVEGVLDRFEEDGVRFGSDALGDVKVAYGKLRALALAAVGERGPAAGGPPAGGAPEARVTLRGGTSFTAAVTGLAAGKLSVHEPVLGALAITLDDVLDIAFQNGRSVYLSDREPVKVVERLGPAFRKTMPYRNDENVLGEPLRMGGREHRKGLGVHSYSLLEYDLGGQFARFQAVIGLDESARPAELEPAVADFADVVFRVRVDGKLLLEKKMSWRDPPLPIDVPLPSRDPASTDPARAARVISLEVDYGAPEGGFNFALDRANWAEARIVR